MIGRTLCFNACKIADIKGKGYCKNNIKLNKKGNFVKYPWEFSGFFQQNQSFVFNPEVHFFILR